MVKRQAGTRTVLPLFQVYHYQNQSNNSNGIPNVIYLSTSNNGADTSSYAWSTLNGGTFLVDLFIGAVGGSSFWEDTPWYYEPYLQQIGISLSGSATSSVHTDILTSYNEGVNITNVSTLQGSSQIESALALILGGGGRPYYFQVWAPIYQGL